MKAGVRCQVSGVSGAHPSSCRAFTLVELLVTIGIIAVLAAILMPAIRGAMVQAEKARAQAEMSGIVAAIKSYHTEYSIYPTPDTNGRKDCTFGGKGNNAPENKRISEILDILRDRDTAANPNHVNNKRRIVFLEIPPNSMAGTDKENNPYNESEGYYLDPWGNPYVITMDTDFDSEVGIFWLEQPAVSDFLSLPNIRNTTANGGAVPSLKVGVLSYGPDAYNANSMLFSWGTK
ncbi:MAG: type II secretion system protein [bacterium]